MKSRTLTVGALLVTMALSSCVNPYAGPYEQNGSVVGAVGGGLLGAIIGNQSGRPLEGAAIGGLLGSLAGSQVGASRDQGYYYGGYNRYYGTPYQPAYVRPVRTYRTCPPSGWGYSPWGGGYSSFGRSGWGSPYRSGIAFSSHRGSSFGMGGGWGCSPWGW